MNLTRTLIIGNSGSGKSWLAERIAASLKAPHLDLDLIHWEPGGFNVARSKDRAIELTREAATGSSSWVIEGIYGWLAREATSMATALIWLCLDEAECAVNLRRRGVRRGGTDDSFKALLGWAETYRTREGSSSHSGHESLFNDFPGAKTCLRQGSEVTAFADFGVTSIRAKANPGIKRFGPRLMKRDPPFHDLATEEEDLRKMLASAPGVRAVCSIAAQRKGGFVANLEFSMADVDAWLAHLEATGRMDVM